MRVTNEDVLQDHAHRQVVRIGDTVRRPVQPWTDTVHTLLHHLEAVGFPYAPRVLGIDDEGREVLSYIEGESGPLGWAKVVDDDGLTAFARLLREYHDATTGFTLPGEAAWAVGAKAPTDAEVVCHGDFGPWNVVWQGQRPVGLIDFDFARPAARLHDIAYALQYVAPFRDDDECTRWLHYPQPPDRHRRLERFCRAYGLSSTDGVVDAVLREQQENAERVRQLAAAGHEPQATWAAEGYLHDLGHKLAWSQAHRHLFE